MVLSIFAHAFSRWWCCGIVDTPYRSVRIATVNAFCLSLSFMGYWIYIALPNTTTLPAHKNFSRWTLPAALNRIWWWCWCLQLFTGSVRVMRATHFKYVSCQWWWVCDKLSSVMYQYVTIVIVMSVCVIVRMVNNVFSDGNDVSVTCVWEHYFPTTCAMGSHVYVRRRNSCFPLPPLVALPHLHDSDDSAHCYLPHTRFTPAHLPLYHTCCHRHFLACNLEEGMDGYYVVVMVVMF